METLMDEVLDTIHNFFVDTIHEGTYTIVNGTLTADFLQNGQYYRVQGSIFNDGVYKYPATDMTDETFTGEVWAMAVPQGVIALIGEIEAWIEQYGGANSALNSPFTSESFNNYSYTKAQGSSSDGSFAPVSWQNIFANRLARWRKLP